MEQLGVFDEDWLQEFRKIAKLSETVPLNGLQNDLREIGRNYRHVIQTTPCDLKGSPFNKTLTQRADWMHQEVVRPTERLLAALADDMRPYFSTWPYEHEFDEFPDRDKLRAELESVLAYSKRLHANLRGEQQADAATSQELRFYIFKDIYAAVRRHLPDFEPSQGVYHSVADGKGKTKRFVGAYPEAIRFIYKHITGHDEQLVRLIRMVVQDPNWEV